MSLQAAAVQRVLDASPAPEAIVSIKSSVLADLLAEWQWMKDELRQRHDAWERVAIQSTFKLRPEGATMLLALYHAPSHMLSQTAWNASREARGAKDDVNERNLGNVHVHYCRKALGGAHTIEVIHGRGWRLPAETAERIRLVLERNPSPQGTR